MAVIAVSSTRSDPAAALRGLANFGSPCSSRSEFRRSKPWRFITTSPRVSKAGQLIVSQLQRHGANCPRILGDVFTHAAIASCHGLRELVSSVLCSH